MRIDNNLKRPRAFQWILNGQPLHLYDSFVISEMTENHENGEDLLLQTDQEDVQVGLTDLDAEHQFAGGDGDSTTAQEESTVEDPELEAIKARVKEMEEEAEKLKQMQKSVDEEMHLTSPTTAAAAGFPSIEEKIDADARSIYVGNVDYGATAEELEQHFHGCGSVNRVTILCDKFTGHPKGFAYVEFADKDSVTTAQALDDSLFRGRQIKVTAKRTNRPGISSTNRRPRGGRGGYGGFRGSSPGGYYTPSRPRGRFGRFRRATYYSPYWRKYFTATKKIWSFTSQEDAKFFFFHFAWEKKNKINFNEYNVNHFNYNNMKYRDFQWKSNTFTQIEDIEILNRGEVKFISSPKLYLNHKNTKINFIWKSEPKLYQY